MGTVLYRGVWVHGYNDGDISRVLASCLAKDDNLIGSSCQAPVDSMFPRGGLVPALQAAMRGELHLLLVTNEALLGASRMQVEETKNSFGNYGVTVRSCNSLDNNSS